MDLFSSPTHNIAEPLNTPDGTMPAEMRQSLEQAFRVFSKASEQLAESYEKLQQTVANLTEELAIANGELKRQYIEKKNLSEHLETLLRALPAGVLVLNRQRYVESANLAAFRLLGADLLHLKWDKIVERLIPTNSASEWEIEIGGSKKRLAIISSPFSVQKSEPDVESESPVIQWETREILLIHDITEIHSMRQALASQQKLAAMGEMTANLAHQLRTPLATALIYAGHLVKEDIPSGKRIEFSAKLLERLRALEKLLTDMLSFVRGESVYWEAFTSTELLQDIRASFEPQCATSDIQFELNDQLQGVRLLGNRKRLEGALTNLLDNAKQACIEGDPPMKIAVSTFIDHDFWGIEVTDSGHGIDQSHLDRIFDPFFTTRSSGTGLGLAIVRSVARSHGGDVEASSAKGQGATFRIRLPIARSLSSEETE